MCEIEIEHTFPSIHTLGPRKKLSPEAGLDIVLLEKLLTPAMKRNDKEFVNVYILLFFGKQKDIKHSKAPTTGKIPLNSRTVSLKPQIVSHHQAAYDCQSLHDTLQTPVLEVASFPLHPLDHLEGDRFSPAQGGMASVQFEAVSPVL